MRFVASIFTGAALVAGLAGHASATTYLVDQMIGTVGRVTGDIVTDGTLGTLTTANFTAWNLLVQGNGASITVTNGSSNVIGTGDAVTATATAISFNYNDPTYSFLGFQNYGSSEGYWCNATTYGSCLQGASAIPDFYYTGTAQYEARSGTQVIAATAVAGVPEPANWALMIAGIGVAGFVMRQRRERFVGKSYSA